MMKSIERVKGNTQEYNIQFNNPSQGGFSLTHPRQAQEDSCQGLYLTVLLNNINIAYLQNKKK